MTYRLAALLGETRAPGFEGFTDMLGEAADAGTLDADQLSRLRIIRIMFTAALEAGRAELEQHDRDPTAVLSTISSVMGMAVVGLAVQTYQVRGWAMARKMCADMFDKGTRHCLQTYRRLNQDDGDEP